MEVTPEVVQHETEQRQELHALGFDLGRLLVGLTQAGLLPASLLDDIADRVVTAYVAGLEEEGVTGQAEAVRDAFVTVALLRSGFDSFLYGLLGCDDPGDRHAFDERVALCGFLAEQYVTSRPA